MFSQSIKSLATITLSSSCLFILNSANLLAQKHVDVQRLSLPSCDVSISADDSTISSKGITYSGNVKVLIGFANLRVDRVTLVKKKNGECELVSGI